MVQKLLADECSQDEMGRICTIIASHNKRGEEASADVMIVQDADILDHFGTQEIWIKFLYAASCDDGPESSVNFWQSAEFKEHLANTRAVLNYEYSRKVYDDRVAFEKEFIERFVVESAGGIYQRNPL